jgi:hypothetical protein
VNREVPAAGHAGRQAEPTWLISITPGDCQIGFPGLDCFAVSGSMTRLVIQITQPAPVVKVQMHLSGGQRAQLNKPFWVAMATAAARESTPNLL